MTIDVYDSQGNPVGTEGGQVNETIKQFFFGGVKLYVDFGRQTKVVAFFRARSSKGSRTEQYYAVYTTRDRTNLFRQFESDLVDHLDREHGMSLETGNDDVIDFSSLDTRSYSTPGSSFDHKVISSLLRAGNRTAFGVSDLESALGLFQAYRDDPAQTVAIANKSSVDGLEACDLLIEVGNYSGVEPVGDTENLFERERSTFETQFVQQKFSNVRSEVDDLRAKSSLSESEIRDGLKRELSVLESPSSSPLDRLGGDGPAGTIAKVAGVGIGIILVLLLVVNVVSMLGLIGLPGAVDPLVVAGDDDPEVTIESIGDEEVDSQKSNISRSLDGNVNVTVRADQEPVWFNYTAADGTQTNETAELINGTAMTSLSIEQRGNLTVTAGDAETSIELFDGTDDETGDEESPDEADDETGDEVTTNDEETTEETESNGGEDDEETESNGGEDDEETVDDEETASIRPITASGPQTAADGGI